MQADRKRTARWIVGAERHEDRCIGASVHRRIAHDQINALLILATVEGVVWLLERSQTGQGQAMSDERDGALALAAGVAEQRLHALSLRRSRQLCRAVARALAKPVAKVGKVEQPCVRYAPQAPVARGTGQRKMGSTPILPICNLT